MLLKLYFSISKKIIFFSAILANNNLPLKIYYENIVIKIDTDFNFNILLKLFFSLSKFFFSPILANNNLPLKIYCEKIVIAFHSSFFFFSPSFFILHMHFFLSFFLFFFSLFFSSTHVHVLFSFLSFFPPFLFPTIPLKSRTFRALLLRLFFFLFFFLALHLLVLGGVVDAGLWERGPLLGKEAFGSVFLAKPTSKFLFFPSLMAVKSVDQCCLVFCWSNLYL